MADVGKNVAALLQIGDVRTIRRGNRVAAVEREEAFFVEFITLATTFTASVAVSLGASRLLLGTLVSAMTRGARHFPSQTSEARQ